MVLDARIQSLDHGGDPQRCARCHTHQDSSGTAAWGDTRCPAGGQDVVASQGDWQGQGKRNLAVAMVTTQHPPARAPSSNAGMGCSREGRDGWLPVVPFGFGENGGCPSARSSESSAQARLGGASMHNHPPNAPKSCSGSEPTQGSGLGSSCRGMEPGSELGSDPRSPSASALPSNQRKQQLGVEQSQMKDVADVSLLPSSPLATWDTMLPGPHPRCPLCHPVARDDGHRGGRWHLPAAPAAVGNRRRRPDRQE